MLIDCEIGYRMWSKVQDWIIELMEDEYDLNNKINIIDGNKNVAYTIITTHVKRAIYTAKMEGSTSTFLLVKNLLKNASNHEGYKATITGKLEDFEKNWELLLNL